MQHKITKKTTALAATLGNEYQKLYAQLCELVEDDAYSKTEINFFLRKSIMEMKKAHEEGISLDEFTSNDIKNQAVEINQHYRDWHEAYEQRMKLSDRTTYAGFLSMVAYSFTLVTITAYNNETVTTLLWIMLPAIVTIVSLGLKIIFARNLKLPTLHVFGDIIIFILVSGTCYFANIYFIVFLWIYEVAYMLYLQSHIVEEDL